MHLPVRVFLLDDHHVVLHGMRIHLAQESDMVVVGKASNSRQMLDGLSRLKVDTLVLDFSLKHQDIDGLNLIRLLRIRHPQVKVLVVSAHYTPDTVRLALLTGAHGYVSKCHAMDEVITAIRVLARNGQYLHPEMAAQVDALKDDTDQGLGLVLASKLTAREHEVVRCILQGMNNAEIATKLSRRANTISSHKAAAFRKLGVASRYELLDLHRNAAKT